MQSNVTCPQCQQAAATDRWAHRVTLRPEGGHAYVTHEGGRTALCYADWRERSADLAAAARALRAIPSAARTEASRRNGRKGGRPRKATVIEGLCAVCGHPGGTPGPHPKGCPGCGRGAGV